MGFLAFFYAWTFAGPLSAAITVMGWALGTSLPAISTFRRQPAAVEVRVLRATAYRAEMLAWLRSGVGPEASPRRTALAHLRELAAYLVAAAATANAGALVLGAILLNYMNAYVARLLAAARRPSAWRRPRPCSGGAAGRAIPPRSVRWRSRGPSP
jgi:hypothetical protein